MENEELKAEIYVLREYVKTLISMLPNSHRIQLALQATQRKINQAAENAPKSEGSSIKSALASSGIPQTPLNSLLEADKSQPGS